MGHLTDTENRQAYLRFEGEITAGATRLLSQHAPGTPFHDAFTTLVLRVRVNARHCWEELGHKPPENLSFNIEDKQS